MNAKRQILDSLLADTPDIFLNAFEASRNGIVITDSLQPDNPIVYCNDAFELLTGYSLEEIIGRNCRFLQGPAQGASTENRIIREAISDGRPVVVDLQNFKKDGTPFWNHLSISALRESNGSSRYFVGIQEDITPVKEQHRELHQTKYTLEEMIASSTAALKASEYYLSSLIDTIRESLVVLDSGLKVTSVNEQFCRTFQVESAAAVGVPITALGDGAWNIPALINLLNHILPSKNPFEGFEMKHDFKGVGVKYLLLNARQIKHEGVFQDRILLAIEDVTLSRLKDQHKEDFINTASHEIKTPLTSVKGYLQVLERQSGKGSVDRNAINAALRSAGRLEQTVHALLQVASHQSDAVEYKATTFDLSQLLDKIVSEVHQRHPTHTVHLNCNHAGTLTTDEKLLKQLLRQLLENAVKFSPKSDRIDVYCNFTKEHFTIKIQDYGIGISADDIPLVFERFFRAPAVEANFPGLGVGLFICQKIALQAGGHLGVTSKPGEGSVFALKIPLR